MSSGSGADNGGRLVDARPGNAGRICDDDGDEGAAEAAAAEGEDEEGAASGAGAEGVGGGVDDGGEGEGESAGEGEDGADPAEDGGADGSAFGDAAAAAAGRARSSRRRAISWISFRQAARGRMSGGGNRWQVAPQVTRTSASEAMPSSCRGEGLMARGVSVAAETATAVATARPSAAACRRGHAGGPVGSPLVRRAFLASARAPGRIFMMSGCYHATAPAGRCAIHCGRTRIGTVAGTETTVASGSVLRHRQPAGRTALSESDCGRADSERRRCDVSARGNRAERSGPAPVPPRESVDGFPGCGGR